MAISADSREDSQQLAERLKIPFALLSDADLAVTKAYGVASAKEAIAVPAVFIVGSDHAIRWREVSEFVPDRPPTATLLDELDRIR